MDEGRAKKDPFQFYINEKETVYLVPGLVKAHQCNLDVYPDQ